MFEFRGVTDGKTRMTSELGRVGIGWLSTIRSRRLDMVLLLGHTVDNASSSDVSQIACQMALVSHSSHLPRITSHTKLTSLTAHISHCSHLSLFTSLTPHISHCSHLSLLPSLTFLISHSSHLSYFSYLSLHISLPPTISLDLCLLPSTSIPRRTAYLFYPSPLPQHS